MFAAVAALIVLFQSASGTYPSLIAKWSEPPRRNFRIIWYDDDFLFVARDYGDARDFGGNTEPGLFVHSKEHASWIQVTQISTAGGRFGTSNTDDPEEQKKLSLASVGWDFRSLAAFPYASQPLKGASSIVFPEKVSYDAATDRYELRYLTSWRVASAETVLYVKREDLLVAFAATTPQRVARPAN